MKIKIQISLDSDLLCLLETFVARQDRVERKLDQIIESEKQLNMTLQDITTKVAAQKTVLDSAVELLKKLAQLVRDNANDPAALQALADSIDANTGEISQAIVDNTPAA